MKTHMNYWKISTLLLGIICISFLLFTSFKQSTFTSLSNYEKGGFAEQNPAIITDRATVRLMYQNFLHEYPSEEFIERSGYIGKTTLATLYTKMRNANDTMVYYYFGRTNDSKNLIMLFNDPKYNPLDSTLKFKTIDPYCPPTCNNAEMNDYVTGH